MKKSQLSLCIDVPLLDSILDEVVDKAKDYALMNGLSMHSSACFDRNCVKISRFTLLPTSFPRNEFEKATNIQATLQKLMHKVAYNHNFLNNTLKSTIEVDDFTAELFKIYKTVYDEGYAQSYSLGLLRSDYLLNGDLEIKQVELNTISSSFAGLAPLVTNLHKFVLSELGHHDKTKNLPENYSCIGYARGLSDAWTLYKNTEAVILFIVEEITCNICDQRAIEFEIRRVNPQIKVIRRTFADLIKQAQLRPNKELIVGNYIVAVAYYRTGYESTAYTSNDVWAIRLLIERSRAIKCPSIQYQLAGTKKVQEALAQPGVLKQFLDESEVTKVLQIFTGLYALEFNELGEKAVAMGISQPEKYVLKPQREGGGNNVYGADIKKVLEKLKNSKERNAFTLMEYIDAPLQNNYFLGPNNDKNTLVDLISELGIYGIIIGNENDIEVNKQVGHVIRTKPFGENEGGIIAGAGGLDSPYLI
ncbi:hypothetical protein PV326_005543 [Microctonus aethiopoides]|nr:hypothetical protein PV326_005543 [Microctonus aethiopoides]